MIRIGKAPYLECSSKGDKRFSAFYAKIKARGNKSIEQLYQAAKVFSDGSTNLSWKQAKGKRAINMFEVSILYRNLWEEYLNENPELWTVLHQASGLQDTFGKPGCNCQAVVLWELEMKKAREGLHRVIRNIQKECNKEEGYNCQMECEDCPIFN